MANLLEISVWISLLISEPLSERKTLDVEYLQMTSSMNARQLPW